MLTVADLVLIKWFRVLSDVEQAAIQCWLETGDSRLMLCLNLICRNLHQIAEIAAPEC